MRKFAARDDGLVFKVARGRLSRVEAGERLSQTKLDVGMRMCGGLITSSNEKEFKSVSLPR